MNTVNCGPITLVLDQNKCFLLCLFFLWVFQWTDWSAFKSGTVVLQSVSFRDFFFFHIPLELSHNDIMWT